MFSGLRLVGALLLAALLLYWTIERFLGEGDDPTLRQSMSSDTGTMSWLVSGTNAVALVAAGIVALLVVPINGTPAVANPTPILAFAGGVTLLHWVIEKEERE